MRWVYRDRTHAGEVLADHLTAPLRDRERPGDVVVLALPRGGVPVAAPVARALGAPLDILAVRKLGVPGHEELAMGAIAAGGVRVLKQAVVTGLGIDTEGIDRVTRAEEGRLADQLARFRGDRAPVPTAGHDVVLIDDGLATGATMEAAILATRRAGAARVVVAVPVGAPATVEYLASVADQVVCPVTPARFRAVGLAYADFSPVADEEVMALLYRCAR